LVALALAFLISCIFSSEISEKTPDTHSQQAAITPPVVGQVGNGNVIQNLTVPGSPTYNINGGNVQIGGTGNTLNVVPEIPHDTRQDLRSLFEAINPEILQKLMPDSPEFTFLSVL
jgi:hypothetical protein